MKTNYLFGLLLALFALGVPAVAQNTPCSETDYDCQIQQETKLIQADPKNADAWYRRGLAKYRKQNYDDAIVDLTLAIQLDPTKVPAYTRRGLSYSEKKQYALAVADFNKSISLDPNYEEAYYSRANARWKQNDLDGAIADYTRYIELKPKNPAYLGDAYCNLGSVKLQQGNALGAFFSFDSAIMVGHRYAHVYRYRGIARAERDDLGGAVADFTEAIKLEPKEASNYKHRAAAYRRLDMTSAAAADEAKAAELDSSSAVTGRAAMVSTSVASLVGTEWIEDGPKAGDRYQFKPDGKVVLLSDFAWKKFADGRWGTWRQENDVVFMDWSSYSIRAKLIGDRVEGTTTFRSGATFPWSASRR